MSNSQSAEPVPPASQLVALPFISAIEGFLRARSGGNFALRVTLHRLLWRHDSGYFQQICNYLGSEGTRGVGTGVGRILPVDQALIGAAFLGRKMFRTRRFSSDVELVKALESDMKATGDSRSTAEVGKSYLAVPFLSGDTPIAVLFAESWLFNLFADDSLVNDVLAMCRGFCRLLDSLESRAVPMIRNFPPAGDLPLATGGTPRYPTIHEALDVPLPRFTQVRGIHYDVTTR